MEARKGGPSSGPDLNSDEYLALHGKKVSGFRDGGAYSAWPYPWSPERRPDLSIKESVENGMPVPNIFEKKNLASLLEGDVKITTVFENERESPLGLLNSENCPVLPKPGGYFKTFCRISFPFWYVHIRKPFIIDQLIEFSGEEDIPHVVFVEDTLLLIAIPKVFSEEKVAKFREVGVPKKMLIIFPSRPLSYFHFV